VHPPTCSNGRWLEQDFLSEKPLICFLIEKVHIVLLPFCHPHTGICSFFHAVIAIVVTNRKHYCSSSTLLPLFMSVSLVLHFCSSLTKFDTYFFDILDF
jgi:hypothetical protein